jgi:hypothetical protein
MIEHLTRTCDLCRREIPAGEYMQRNAGPSSVDVLMVLVENEGKELKLIELPDGTVSLDTCRDCYSRMAFNHSKTLN